MTRTAKLALPGAIVQINPNVHFNGVLKSHCAGVKQSSGIHIQLLAHLFGGVAPTSLVANGACSVRLLLLCIIPHL